MLVFVKVVDNFPFVFNSIAQVHYYRRSLILGFMSLPCSVIEYRPHLRFAYLHGKQQKG